MPVLNTFSNLSKRGFGSLLALTPFGTWVPMQPVADPLFFNAGRDIAVSDDGGRFAVARNSNTVRMSSDFGVTGFEVTVGSLQVQTIGMSYNGQYLIAGSGNNAGLYVSSDFGATWTLRQSLLFPIVGVSPSGQYQTAFQTDGANNFTLYRSTNYGASFTAGQTFSSASILKPTYYGQGQASIRMSADGQYQIAPGNTKPIISTNYGVTWQQCSGLPVDGAYYGATMSDTGQYQTVCVDGGYIYVSQDFGVTWTQQGAQRGYIRASMSADGSKQTVNFQSGASPKIVMSYDYGNTFEEIQPTDTGSLSDVFYIVGMARNGRYQYAVNYTGAKAQKNVS